MLAVVVGLIILTAEGATYEECPDTGACAAEIAPDDGVIPNVVDESAADECAALKTSGNAGWLDYGASGAEDVMAVAERYVVAQEPGSGPQYAEGQRVRLVVSGPPGEGARSPGSACANGRS